MEILPDDLWHQILKTGTETGRLDHKDLCSLSMTCPHFDKLAQDSDLWAALLCRDFNLFDQTSSKALYKEEFENQEWLRLFASTGYWFEDFGLTEEVHEPIYEEPIFPLFWYEPPPFTQPIINHNHSMNINLEWLDHEYATDRRPSTSRATHVPYVKDGFSKRRNKAPRPKVNPSSKSYISMRKAPRRTMPRKI